MAVTKSSLEFSYFTTFKKKKKKISPELLSNRECTVVLICLKPLQSNGKIPAKIGVLRPNPSQGIGTELFLSL